MADTTQTASDSARRLPRTPTTHNPGCGKAHNRSGRIG